MSTKKSREFFESLQNALAQKRQSTGQRSSSDEEREPPKKAQKLSNLAFEQSCRDLGESITGARADACFACGGTIPTVSSVRLFWDTADDAEKRKLVLPLESESTGDNGIERLHQLVSDCEPASFGRGQQDVLDPEYRRAGKLDPSRFVSDFDPHETGIMRLAEQYLLPNYKKDQELSHPFRVLKAELYKLNVYSGPSGLFQKHVDTPRSQGQIGSLVVSLPSSFKGGNLVVRHAGKEVDFDWAVKSGSTVQWAAFYSDCEHEIMTVTEGERVTLTYNLFVVEPKGQSIPQSDITDPTKMPLYESIKDRLREPGFMKDGGVLGIYCSHAYPHAAENAQQLLPGGLKGSDLALYCVFKSLKLKVGVLPVLDDDYYEDSTYYCRDRAVGEHLHPFTWSEDYPDQSEGDRNILREIWPAKVLRGVTWLAKPKYEQMACSYVTYGNEYTSQLRYSYAAIFAVIPPFAKRQRVVRVMN